jgi:adenine-specific DNA-methyltransferase
MDFFALPLTEQYDTIIGNPPYVRFQDIPRKTLALLDNAMFDRRSNLYLHFIEKAVRHLRPGGELIFIVPREFAKLTAARRLNSFLYEEGDITDFIETGDTRIFGHHNPNCVIFRFEKGRHERRLHDGRHFRLVDGQLMFLRKDYRVPLADLFDVKVGAVSGADAIFEQVEGDTEFVCSKTIDDGRTRRMIFGGPHPALAAHKEALLARRVRHFDESNWWQWGRLHHISGGPRIYVNCKTRRPKPFFQHPCPNYDGAILALFPKVPMNLDKVVAMLNNHVDWEELGFVCDGRFLFTQRSLQNCLLPAEFDSMLPAARPRRPLKPSGNRAGIHCVALFGKGGSAEVVESLVSLLEHLHSRGLNVLVEETIAADLGMVAAAAGIESICRNADVAIVLGGDGTLLNAARRLAAHDVPLVGINQGRLGFMTDIARTEMISAIDKLLDGEFAADRRMLLEVSVVRAGKELFRALALNDMVINKGDLGRMIEVEVRVDGESLYVLRADGLIVATPTGSTAYALSANGPILQPAVPGIALVPLCPHALTHRPITISDTCRIEMQIAAPFDARVHCDGQDYFDVCAGDIVTVERSSHAVALLHPPGYSYFAMLREKLHWSATPRR